MIYYIIKVYLVCSSEVPLVELEIDLGYAGVHSGADARLVVLQQHLTTETYSDVVTSL